jgi:polyribonucleotide nucleotidyltransferase
MTAEKKQFLEETNALLKQVGSRERIESKEQKENSLEFKINNFFKKPVKAEVKSTEKKEEKKDVNSFIYFKNKRELAIYSKKLSSTELDIIKSIFTFQFSKVRKLLLRRKLISQNIEIIDNRINNRVISYTQMVHGVEYYVDNIFAAIKLITNVLTYTLFLYTLSYITLIILNST